jgi:hypothetical protein
MVRLARGLTLRIWWTLKFCSKAFNKTTPSRLAFIAKDVGGVMIVLIVRRPA